MSIENEPVTTEQQSSEPIESASISENAWLDRFDEVFGGGRKQKADNAPTNLLPMPTQQGAASEPVAANNAPAGQTQPQPAVEKTPDMLFSEGNEKAFLGDDGLLNTSAFSDILGKAGQLTGFDAPFFGNEVAVQPKPVETTPDVEFQEYRRDLTDTALGWHDKVMQIAQQNGGNFPAALEQVRQEYDLMVKGHLSEREKQVSDYLLEKKINEKLSNDPIYRKVKEAEEIDKRSKLEKNISTISQQFNGLIPGLNGEQVFNQLVFNKKYGGEAVLRRFTKENPNFNSLSPEEKEKVSRKFENDLLSNPSELKEIVELAQLKWIVKDQIPKLIKHVQQIAVQNKQNASESRGYGVSKYPTTSQGQPNSNAAPSQVESWLYGKKYDSVI